MAPWDHCPAMTIEPSQLQQDEEVYCYGHPNTPTRLRCSRCDRPICGRCAIPATVGQHCPECVAEARRTAPKVRSTFAAIAPATRAIIITCVVFFVGQAFIPGLTERFASLAPAIAAGEWWRLLTPMFLHAGLLHIFFNMYVLSMFGPVIERSYGTPAFVAMYVLAGYGGSAASYALGSCGVLGVGASGAIFGLAGALVAYFWRRRELSTMAPYLRSLMVFIALNLLIGFGVNFLPFPVRIDNLAHLGGLITGTAVGLGFDRRRGEVPLGQYVTVAVVAAVAITALVVWRTTNFAC